MGDYHALFKSGKATPTDMVNKLLQLIDESNNLSPPLRAFVRTNRDLSLKLAEESTLRYKSGNPLSILDGIPMGFKDTNVLAGWITGSGTDRVAKLGKEDEDWVSNLKSLGVVPIGITLSSETANTAFGPNVLHGLPLNPYAPKHITGASSAGTAAAISAGLVPLATGSDGAGSIRIPSSWCGNYGIKTTFGRCGIMETQASPLSVQGPHGMDVDTIAAGYWAMGRKGGEAVGVVGFEMDVGPFSTRGRSLSDRNLSESNAQPPPSLLNYSQITDLSDLRIGIFLEWFADADTRIVEAGKDLLARLETRGAKIVTLELNFSVAASMAAHRINFGSWIRNSGFCFDSDGRASSFSVTYEHI